MIGEKKICPACGKEFIQTRTRQKYCDNPHYKPCPICGKMILMKYPGDPAPACSPECRKKLRERHKLEKEVQNESSKSVSSDTKSPKRDKEEHKTVQLFNNNSKTASQPDLKVSQGETKTSTTTNQSDKKSTKKPDNKRPEIPESLRSAFSQTTETVDTSSDSDYARTTNRASPLKITLTWNEDGENQHHVIYQYNRDLMGFKKDHEYDIDIIRNPSSKYYGYVIKSFDENEEPLEMPTSSFIMVNRYFRAADKTA